MPLIKNPNPDGRIVEGLGLVGPGESREVSEAMAADLCDGVNFVRNDAPAAKTEDAPAKPSRPKPSNDD